MLEIYLDGVNTKMRRRKVLINKRDIALIGVKTIAGAGIGGIMGAGNPVMAGIGAGVGFGAGTIKAIIHPSQMKQIKKTKQKTQRDLGLELVAQGAVPL